MQRVAQEHANEAIAVFVGALSHRRIGVRMAAAKELLDRGYGRPAQALTDADGGALRGPTTVTHVHVRAGGEVTTTTTTDGNARGE